MDARRAGLEPHTVAAALLHDLRLLQNELVDRRHDHAVARFAGVPNGGGYLVVVRLDGGKLREQTHEIAVVRHIKAGLLAERLIEQRPRELKLCAGGAAAERDSVDLCAADALVGAHGVHRGRDLADAVQSLGALADAAVKAELDGMVGGQRQDPCRDMKLQLGQRELVEDRLEDIPHRRVVQLQAVDRQTAHAIV